MCIFDCFPCLVQCCLIGSTVSSSSCEAHKDQPDVMMSWSRCGTGFVHHVRSSAHLAMSSNREPYHKWPVDMHPHLHSVKPPIEIHTFFWMSLPFRVKNQLENGKSLDSDRSSFALGSGRPAPARLLVTDNGHVFQRPRATLFSCLEPGIRFQHREECTPLSISMRACDEHLACDGPLTVLVCQLHVIPSSAHIPDLLFLFEDPCRGRQILQGILD